MLAEGREQEQQGDQGEGDPCLGLQGEGNHGNGQGEYEGNVVEIEHPVFPEDVADLIDRDHDPVKEVRSAIPKREEEEHEDHEGSGNDDERTKEGDGGKGFQGEDEEHPGGEITVLPAVGDDADHEDNNNPYSCVTIRVSRGPSIGCRTKQEGDLPDDDMEIPDDAVAHQELSSDGKEKRDGWEELERIWGE